MKHPLYEPLLAFVKAVQNMEYSKSGLHNLSTLISGDPDLWKSRLLNLSFGDGYFDGSKVLIYLDHEVLGEAKTEEAVAAYLEGRVPQVEKKV